jgi:aspartate racemase
VEVFQLKTIGLVGGMSWESSAEYYRIINETVKGKLGGLHSAVCILSSLDFYEIEKAQSEGDWERVSAILSQAAIGLEKAGADFFLLCSNTVHKVAALIEQQVTIPLLHIAAVTANEVLNHSLSEIGLLGTRFTMEENFYSAKLAQQGIKTIIPSPVEREIVDRIIFQELCQGIVKPESKIRYLAIINNLVARGAEGIILGCTEIGLLVGPEDTDIPLFDSLYLHAVEAVRLALSPTIP